MKTCSDDVLVFMNDRNAKQEVNRTATSGNPFFVQYENTFGACPLTDNPYRIRDAQNKNEFPAENADVKMAPLIICGRTLIPARVKAIT